MYISCLSVQCIPYRIGFSIQHVKRDEIYISRVEIIIQIFHLYPRTRDITFYVSRTICDCARELWFERLVSRWVVAVALHPARTKFTITRLVKKKMMFADNFSMWYYGRRCAGRVEISRQRSRIDCCRTKTHNYGSRTVAKTVGFSILLVCFIDLEIRTRRR